jgi:hypothetical protein
VSHHGDAWTEAANPPPTASLSTPIDKRLRHTRERPQHELLSSVAHCLSLSHRKLAEENGPNALEGAVNLDSAGSVVCALLFGIIA